MMNRLAWVGLLVAIIAVVFFYTRVQESEGQLDRLTNTLVTLQADGADNGRIKAGQAADISTLQAGLGNAADARASAEAQAAAIVATVTAESQFMRDSAATTQAQGQQALVAVANSYSTEMAAQADSLSTAQAQISHAADNVATAEAAYATLSAQANLDSFARDVAEQDRATALALLAPALTQIAMLQSTLTAAQPTPTPAPMQAPVPTTIIEPTPEPAATTVNSTSQTAHFNSADKGLSFDYPAGWTTQDLTEIVIVTNMADMPDLQTLSVKDGEFFVMLLVMTGKDFTGNDGSSATDIITSLREQTLAQTNPPSLSEPVPTAFGGRDGAFVTGTENGNHMLVNVVDMGQDHFLVTLSYATLKDAAEHTQFVGDILTSATVS